MSTIKLLTLRLKFLTLKIFHHLQQFRLVLNKYGLKVLLGLMAMLFAVSSKALATNIPSCDFWLIDWLINILPETPQYLKLANIFTKFAIQAPIGSAVIFEAYSRAFQVMSLVAFFQAVKLLVYLKKLVF
ncbi:MAG: hypothetical protein WBA93_31320 [Microcoleaceae cyanobacterium]